MRTLLFAACAVALVFVGCGKKDETTGTPKTGDVKPAVPPVAATMTVDIGCAHCLYKIAGVNECAPAVTVNGKTMLLSGGNVDMKTADICKAAKKATVEGKVEGDKFVATKVDIAK